MPLTLEQLDRIKREAAKKKPGSGGGPPNFHQPREGKIAARFYEDSAGEAMGESLNHFDGINNLPCLGPKRCQICAACDEITGWSDLNRYKTQRRTLMYAYIFNSQGLNDRDSRYLKLETAVLFVGKGMLRKLVSEYCASLASTQEINDFFDPARTGVDFVVELTILRKSPWLEMKTRLIEPTTIPTLPRDFPPLSECLKPREPDRAKVAAFLQTMRAAYDRFLGIKEPPARNLQYVDDIRVIDSPALRATEPVIAATVPVISDPDDFYYDKPDEISTDSDDFDAAPHANCPTYFGHMPTNHPVCRCCDAWWDCQRHTLDR